MQGRLWPQLRGDYGVGPTYMVAQVERSAQRAQLPPGALALCYAATLSDTAFAETCPARAGQYAALLQVLQACAARRPVSSCIQPADENDAAFTGVGDGQTWL